VPRELFLKKDKKIKFEKGEQDGKNSENRHLLPRRGAGDLPPNQRAGGSKNISRPLPRASSFFIRKEVPEQASRPASGREVPLLIIFIIFCWNCYVLLEFMVYKLFEIQNFFKYNIYSPYSFVYI
jgi:hypothetical protein